MKKYSIIVTVYNGEKYIKKCIDSIINQTLKNFELIIIDDGSIDDTRNIIKPYLSDKNIEYYYKQNTGVADSRNYGISKVKTKYFLFVDGDDYIRNDLIETIDKYNNYDILSFMAITVNSKYREIMYRKKGIFNLIDGKSYLINLMSNDYLFIAPWGYVYNTEYFKKNKFEYTKNYVHEDLGLTPIIILKSEKIISIDYYGYYYYQSEDSITRTNDEEKIKHSNYSILYQYDKLIKYVDENYNNDMEFTKKFKSYFSNVLIYQGYMHYNQKYLNDYIKQLKLRNVLNNLIITNKKTFVEFILCNISYRLYYIIHKIYCVITNLFNKKI